MKFYPFLPRFARVISTARQLKLCPGLDLIARKVRFRVESIYSFPPKPRLAGLLSPPLLGRCSRPGGGGASRCKEKPRKFFDLGAQVYYPRLQQQFLCAQYGAISHQRIQKNVLRNIRWLTKILPLPSQMLGKTTFCFLIAISRCSQVFRLRH